jgi:hypothetical protein
MSDDKDQTKPAASEFDFSAFPENTLFHERRTGPERRKPGAPPPKVDGEAAPAAREQRRAKKERRRRIDPTTFEKQYTPDELEFMNAMQRFKERSGKSFPTHGETLMVAVALGYRRVIVEPEPSWSGIDDSECAAESSTLDALPETPIEPVASRTGAY